jgi:hypothetical protein
MSEAPELRVDRLRWAGPLTVVASVVVVAIIREIAVAVVQPPTRYLPLLRPFPIFDTAVLATAAVLVFVRFCRDNADPIADYRRLAVRILLVSFVPDILLAVTHAFGGGWTEAPWLMAMHIAVWGICITVLPAAVTIGRPRDETEHSGPTMPT